MNNKVQSIFEIIVTKLFNLTLFDDEIPFKPRYHKIKKKSNENHFEDKSGMVIKETTIVNDWKYGKDPDHAVIPAIHQRIDGFNVGDKVAIIIIKIIK